MSKPIDIFGCLVCGLEWNNAEPTSMTPTPGGRCPFEWFHHSLDKLEDEKLNPEDIPDDWPVQPWLGSWAELDIEWNDSAYDSIQVPKEQLPEIVAQYLNAYSDNFNIRICIKLDEKGGN